ncbi:hypothetical protein [Mesorhizobium sp. IMUNJ 23232]|uniref:hypothetical protein n=1 Tax=Mesorhizobium sp. IMUNJ 23232 TaxID=3376064 RepID=UPI0037B8C2AF
MKSKKAETKADDKPPIVFPKFDYTVDELLEVSAGGRTLLYDAIGEGKLIARKEGRRTVILHDEYLAYLKSLPAIPPRAPTPVDGEGEGVAP